MVRESAGPASFVRQADRPLPREVGCRSLTIKEIYAYSGLKPDLVISKLIAPSTAQIGQTISILNVVKNYGGVKAGQSVTRFYLSKNAEISPANDRFLGKRLIPELPSLTTSTANTPVVIPADVTPGTYFIGAVADAKKSVNEADEQNNVKVRKIIITD